MCVCLCAFQELLFVYLTHICRGYEDKQRHSFFLLLFLLLSLSQLSLLVCLEKCTSQLPRCARVHVGVHNNVTCVTVSLSTRIYFSFSACVCALFFFFPAPLREFLFFFSYANHLFSAACSHIIHFFRKTCSGSVPFLFSFSLCADSSSVSSMLTEMYSFSCVCFLFHTFSYSCVVFMQLYVTCFVPPYL